MPEERKFTGLDAYQKAIDSGVDLVLLCTPPGFRPAQFEAAVKAGKHVFMEKPVATDAPGVRRVMAANEEAKKKKLAVAVGHHLRHETKHLEVVQRIHDGAIGELQFLRVYFNSNGVWVRPRQPGQTEMQYQVRNWYYFTWLSGDHIVEQHVHDIDVGNWIAQGHPVEAQGHGRPAGPRRQGRGRDLRPPRRRVHLRQRREDVQLLPAYPRLLEFFAQHAHGTKGKADFKGQGETGLFVDGQEPVRWKHGPDGHQVEMDDLFAALVAGQALQRGRLGHGKHDDRHPRPHGHLLGQGGHLGRGDQVASWTCRPKRLAWDAEPRVKPGADGCYACAIPGVTKAW